MFKWIDSDGDRRLSLEEFRQAVPALQKWGIAVPDAEEAFRAIDSDGGGMVLFDEFCAWAAANNLDLAEDGNFDLEQEDIELLKQADIKVSAKFTTSSSRSPNTNDGR